MRTFLLGWLLWTTPASAQDPAAELRRLEGEIRTLAQKNAWSGVDRTYRAMVALEIPLPGADHALAAQAAIADGDALLALLRLRRVVESPEVPDDPADATARADAKSALERLATRYGPVSLSVGTGRDPTLLRPEAPFAPDERVAIKRATERLAADRLFRGLLPVGRYVVDGVMFEVVAGDDWQSVVLAAVGQH